TVPRQVAMYLMRQLLGLSLVEIGRLFGGRDHSTVIHSIEKVKQELASDEEFRARVEAIRAELARWPQWPWITCGNPAIFPLAAPGAVGSRGDPARSQHRFPLRTGPAMRRWD